MTTVAPPDRGPAMLARLTGRALRDARARTLGFAYLFAAIAYLQPVAYRHTYATLAQRLAFAHSFGSNGAVVLFYGKAYDLLSVGGYTAWRVGGTLSILAAVFGLLAAVRALRTEEESGRAELVLAGPVSRAQYLAGALVAIGVQAGVLWLAVLVGCVLGGLPAGPSAYLALAIVSPAAVLAGVGGVVSQLAPSRRLALELGGAVVGVCFLTRVVADTATGAGWLRWVTPLGWAELMRPFTGARALVMIAPALTTAALLAALVALARARDLGRGLISPHERRAPRRAWLRGGAGHALAQERTALAVWLAGCGAFAFVYGVISKSISAASIPASLAHALARLGAGPQLSARTYLAFAFSLVALVVCLLAVGQVGAARHEELDGRLAGLLALPLTPGRWLAGRLGLALGALVAVGLLTGIAAWAGAALSGESIGLGQMLEAGLNCLPVAVLFLGVTALLYALMPHAAAAAGYGVVVVSFLWQEVGALLGAPRWLVDATPFAHLALVPAVPVSALAAVAMVAAGAVAAALAVAAIGRRDVAVA